MNLIIFLVVLITLSNVLSIINGSDIKSNEAMDKNLKGNFIGNKVIRSKIKNVTSDLSKIKKIVSVVNMTHVKHVIKQINMTRVGVAMKKIMAGLRNYYGDNDGPVNENKTSIRSYLRRFGYIDFVKRNISETFLPKLKKNFEQRVKGISNESLISYEDIREMGETVWAAIKHFQRFMGLSVTGEVNEKTLLTMNKPRCGGKDLGEQRISPNYMTLKAFRNRLRTRLRLRPKRHVLAGSRWTIKNITYKITRYPTSYFDRRAVVNDQIEKALNLWSNVTPLQFTRLPSTAHSSDVHIDIRFEKGEHGDGDSLDGVGKVLAHAYFPQYGGDAHFDDDEIWTINTDNGSNIMITAAHELGHSLGLDHSDVPDSIMNPIYPPYHPGRELSEDDIKAIQTLYGSKSLSSVPNLCVDASVDSIILMSSGRIIVFQANHFWKIDLNTLKIEADYPKLISQTFKEIKTKINDAIRMSDKSILIFSGEFCYKFVNLKIVKGFPKKIKDLFPSLPTYPDAVFELNGIIYAFKGKSYYQYVINSKVKQKENSKPIQSKWKGIPNDITASFKLSNNAIYFFKGQEYYRISIVSNDTKAIVSSPPYPRKTSFWWFGCQ